MGETTIEALELERLEELRAYAIVDAEREPAFDRITARLARLLEVPVALITVIDQEVQWFKSCYGTDLTQTGRDSAFCEHTIQSPDPLVVNDATKDPRFALNPLVVGEPNVRFYAGAPLRTPRGHNLGSLCVIDTKPRTLTEDQIGLLTDLAAMVVDEMELRRAHRALQVEMTERHKVEQQLVETLQSLEQRVKDRTSELQETNASLRVAEERFRSIFENAVDGIFQTTVDGHYLAANPALAGMYGYDSPADLATAVGDIEHQLYLDPHRREDFLAEIRTAGVVRGFESQIRRRDGSIIWISETARAVRNGAGAIDFFEGTVKDITRRKIAEEALQVAYADMEIRVRERTADLEKFNLELAEALRANNLYSAAIRSSVVGVLITDPRLPDNPTVLINPAFERITGYSAEDCMGKNCRFLQGKDSSQEVIAEMRMAMREPRPFRNLILNYRKDGTPFWNELAIYPMFDEEGTLINFVGLQNDVTERVLAQQALHESEARLKSILDNTTSVVYIKNLDGSYQLVNPRFEELFHCRVEDLRAPHADGLLFPPELMAAIVENDRAVFASDRPLEFEETVRQGDELRTYISVKFPLRDADGRVRGLCGLSTDITARKQAEAALQQSEARKAAILEAALDAVITIDYQGRIMEVNPAAERIFGYRAKEILGLEMASLILLPEARHAHTQGLQRLLERGNGPILGKRLELPSRRKDGSAITIEAAITRIATSGRPLFTGYIRDITTRKKTEAALQEAKVEAERANTAKSDFLSRMSHELRTPLNAILGFSQLMQRRKLDTRQEESVGFIIKAGRHLLDLVNEVLDLARIESGRTSWSPEAVNVRAVLAESLDLVRPQAQERAVELLVDATLRETSCFVMADPQRLKQIFVNLLSNGVKYNQECGRVTISCRQAGEAWAIDFCDTGTGIPEDKLGLLFIPFERLGADASGVEGSGIGLAITQRLATLMGGSIEVKSVRGEGSTFSILLPRAQPAAPPVALRARADAAGETPAVQRIVLYIEDHAANLRLMEHVAAEHGGIQLITCQRGREAVALAREHQPALILLDLHLPDLGGAQVLELLRREPALQGTPILIVSADAMNGQVSKLLAAGANAYITKPIEVESMLQHFHRHLKSA